MFVVFAFLMITIILIVEGFLPLLPVAGAKEVEEKNGEEDDRE